MEVSEEKNKTIAWWWIFSYTGHEDVRCVRQCAFGLVILVYVKIDGKMVDYWSRIRD